jgi:tetratricopeptide (TPR) repeat protein
MQALRAGCCFVIAGLLVVLAALPVSAQSEIDPYFEFLTARRLESGGDVDGALAALKRAEAADPESAEIRAELAAFYMRQNKLDEAETAGRDALARDQESIEAHRVLGLIYSAYAEGATESGQAAKAPDYVREAIGHLERVVSTPAGATDVTVQYNLGRLYIRAGDSAKAIEVLTRVVDEQPYSVQARLALAQAQGAANRDDDAIETLKPAVEDEPRLNATLAQLYERAGRYKDAANAYSKALEVNPSSRDLKMRLASALIAVPGRANSRRAIEIVAPLIQDNPKDTRALYVRSQAERRMGDFASAEKDARAIMAADPDAVSGPYALADVYSAAHRYKDVVELLEPLVAKPSGSQAAPLLTALSGAYEALGEYQKAIDTLLKARSAGSNDSSVDAHLVQVHLEAKRYAEAAVLAAEAQKLHPEELRFTRLHARALFEAGAGSRAIQLMEATLRAHPNDSASYLAMADLYSDSGRIDEAVKTLDRAAELFPTDTAVPFQRGAILEKAHRDRDAEAAFRRVLEMEPESADALNYLGYMLADRGQRLEEAIKLIMRALDIEPDNPSYLDSLGWAYFKRGDLAQAQKHLVRAADALPRNSVVQDHLGDLLSRAGKPRDAVVAWTRALDGDGEQIDRTAIEKKIRDANAKATR